MPDEISKSDRALIDAAVAAGKVQKIPRGQSGYDPLAKDGWREKSGRGVFAKQRQRAAAFRRAKVRELSETMTAQQISDAMDRPMSLIKADLQRMGIKAVDGRRRRA